MMPLALALLVAELRVLSLVLAVESDRADPAALGFAVNGGSAVGGPRPARTR
jgi:hypothetical protein